MIGARLIRFRGTTLSAVDVVSCLRGRVSPLISKTSLPAEAFWSLRQTSRFHTSTKLFKSDDNKYTSLNESTRSRREPPEAKAPFSWTKLGVMAFVFGSCYAIFMYERRKADELKRAERKREIGKARIGGNFALLDHNGTPKTNADFLGKWLLIYFGFTHCPDVCPDEMEKMAEITDIVTKKIEAAKYDTEILPLFITVDPERDGVKEVNAYIKEFHPKIVGLTGPPDKIMEACKSYRVYYSAGPKDVDEDYIVDHTIIIYLVDPEGQFVDYYGQTKTAENVSEVVMAKIKEFEGDKRRQNSIWKF